MVNEERWVGVEEVAAHLGVAKESVYRWVEGKGLPAHRVGRLLRFRLSEIDDWVQEGGGNDSGSTSTKESPVIKAKSNPRSKKKRLKRRRNE